MPDYHYREAAESLLGSASNTNYRTISHSQSLNLVADELIAGHRPNGKMSSVRRFFCLFVTFDLLFTSLMWLICVMIRGVTLIEIFNSELVHYNVKTSLFDIVVVAIVRFLVLLLFYGILYINHWCVIALSTGGSCALLIAKVFVFNWLTASEPVYSVFLIITSFTLSWGEAWFLDFRVIPQETQAKQLLEAIAVLGTERVAQPQARVLSHGESTVNWFSPVETPETTPGPGRNQIILTQEQIDEYQKQAEQGMQDAYRIVQGTEWRLEKRGATRGDVVESQHTDKFGKVYRFTGTVNCPAKILYEEFRDNITNLPEWNPTILKCELIKEISPGVDLSYQVTAGGGRGIISPRDFVILRRNAALNRAGAVTEDVPYAYINSGISCTVPGYPPKKDIVRGQNKVGCWFLRPKTVKTPDGKTEDVTVFQWLMCCDLKGKIPQFILDAAFSTVMLDYIVHVRKFAADCKAKGMF